MISEDLYCLVLRYQEQIGCSSENLKEHGLEKHHATSFKPIYTREKVKISIFLEMVKISIVVIRSLNYLKNIKNLFSTLETYHVWSK